MSFPVQTAKQHLSLSISYDCGPSIYFRSWQLLVRPRVSIHSLVQFHKPLLKTFKAESVTSICFLSSDKCLFLSETKRMSREPATGASIRECTVLMRSCVRLLKTLEGFPKTISYVDHIFIFLPVPFLPKPFIHLAERSWAIKLKLKTKFISQECLGHGVPVSAHS